PERPPTRPTTPTPPPTMSESMFKPPKVPKALRDQDNYHTWAASMKRILLIAGMSPVVTGNQTTRPATSPDEWDLKSAKALVTIIANCEEEPQSLIEDCDTPAEAWGILKAHFEGRTRTHLSALL